ncbi:MAG: cellulase family glycosylhydrolase [Anaerolineae bacterium]|jgi:polysaccharide biosynthesis protein PslG
MTARRPRSRWAALIAVSVFAIAALAGSLILAHPLWSDFLYGVTGEETLPAQVRGGLEWLGNLTRPRPETADEVPVANAGMNPFGVNTFLQDEVEPAKREQAIQMIADAGFHWIRQEFPWEDIEIHGKGDFEDRRHEPARSAWAKYDHIVALAEQYGLEIIVRLSNPPAWSRAEGNEGGTLAPPDTLEDYGDFVEAVVRRYEGRIRYYQIWNEPNIYPEWGEQPVSPEGYTKLLEVGYRRIKAICPDCVVISGALAQTIPLGPRDLNDFVFLQRMYEAGAGDYFDVLAMQGYGLWSGPTDQRMRPRVLNFSRPMYLREIMVKNGDAHKPIWITEMNWNAPPADFPNKQFGYVTPEQQARYAVDAFRRAQEEWPWLGVVNVWFFKRATDAESDQPMYYFRLVEPDFTPMPVYDALAQYFHSSEARRLFSGVHQENDWALTYDGPWETQLEPSAELGAVRRASSPGASLSFTFDGTDLRLTPGPRSQGTILYTVDSNPEQTLDLEGGQEVRLAEGLVRGAHSVVVRMASGSVSVDSLTVEQRARLAPWLVGIGVVLALGLAAFVAFRAAAGRRRWYERSRAGA